MIMSTRPSQRSAPATKIGAFAGVSGGELWLRVFAPQPGHKAADAIGADYFAPLAAAIELGLLIPQYSFLR
jgi:hypothetical protein